MLPTSKAPLPGVPFRSGPLRPFRSGGPAGPELSLAAGAVTSAAVAAGATPTGSAIPTGSTTPIGSAILLGSATLNFESSPVSFFRCGRGLPGAGLLGGERLRPLGRCPRPVGVGLGRRRALGGAPADRVDVGGSPPGAPAVGLGWLAAGTQVPLFYPVALAGAVARAGVIPMREELRKRDVPTSIENALAERSCVWECGRVGIFPPIPNILPNAQTQRFHLQGFLHGSVTEPKLTAEPKAIGTEGDNGTGGAGPGTRRRPRAKRHGGPPRAPITGARHGGSPRGGATGGCHGGSHHGGTPEVPPTSVFVGVEDGASGRCPSEGAPAGRRRELPGGV